MIKIITDFIEEAKEIDVKTQTQLITHIEILPDEIIIEIILFIPFNLRNTIYYVNKSWYHTLDQSPYFWKTTCEQMKIPCLKYNKQPSSTFWKKRAMDFIKFNLIISPYDDSLLIHSDKRIQIKDQNKDGRWCYDTKNITSTTSITKGKHILQFKAGYIIPNLYYSFVLGITPRLNLHKFGENSICNVGITTNISFFVWYKYNIIKIYIRTIGNDNHFRRKPHMNFEKKEVPLDTLFFFTLFLDIENEKFIVFEKNEKVLETRSSFVGSRSAAKGRKLNYRNGYDREKNIIGKYYIWDEFHFSFSMIGKGDYIEVVNYTVLEEEDFEGRNDEQIITDFIEEAMKIHDIKEKKIYI